MQRTRAELSKRRSRGAALVEAVVVLPVFIVIFAGTLYVRDRVLARQAARAHARSCAWRYSMDSCQAVPEGCDDILTQVPASRDPELESTLKGAITNATKDADDYGIVGAVVDPLLTPAIDAALGNAASATTTYELERPGVFGGGIRTIEDKYTLSCNLAPTTPAKVAEDAWNLFKPKL